MEIDSLELPVDWEKVRIHKEANRIGKVWIDERKIQESMPSNGQICKHCGRIAAHCPHFKFGQSTEEMSNRYGVYGPNNVIYFGFLRRLAYFMLACTIVFCIPMFIINLAGRICRDSQTACNEQDVIYFWSTYNVLGARPGSLPHHILWFVFSIALCLFSLYLRKYSVQTYRQLNNRNYTDSDFAIILRRLPNGTTQDQIIHLIERQIPALYQQNRENSIELLNQLRQVKVRDVIMIYRFGELMDAHKQNVKDLKKHYKKNKKKTNPPHFQPEKLPDVAQFGNAAIVRFNNSKDGEIVAETVKVNCKQTMISYLFPFYSPKSQYVIRQEQISIALAPQPSDIQWENIGYTESFRVIRKLISTAFTLALLIISAGVSIALSVWIQNALVDNNTSPAGVTILLVLVTLIFNVIIRKIVEAAIKFIRLDTFTDQNSEQLTITIVNQSINMGFFNIFAPIIAKIPTFLKLQDSESSNFPLVMFTTIIVQSLIATTLHFFLKYYEIKQKVFKFLDNRGLKINTQTEAYRRFKGIQVPIVSGYAFNVKIVWFGFLFGVVSPICVAFATLALFLQYLFERILFNSKYSIPTYGGPRINATMLDMIDILPFLIGLFNLLLYNTSQEQRSFQFDNRITGIIVANIVIGGIFALFPSRLLIEKLYNEKLIQSTLQFNRESIFTTYEKEYPKPKPGAQFVVKDRHNNFIQEGKRKLKMRDDLQEMHTDSFIRRQDLNPSHRR